MQKNDRIKVLCQLGSFFDSYCNNHAEIKNNKFYKKFELVINYAISSNPYFEKQNIHYNLKYWAKILKENVLESFSSKIFENKKIKSIGIIMAGNIPLVGFHDFLCVFLSGNKSDIKLSKKDSHLFRFIYSFLKEYSSDVKKYIEINDSILQDYDAVIATGNDLSANQFKKYFDKVPNIIRNSRFSVGLLKGDESDHDLKKLSFDIFMYYGLGCRSVSKLYLPKGYDINLIINSLNDWKDVINNSTYYNNYTYNKTIYLMKGERFFDTGFCIIKESNLIGSPIATIYYEYYQNIEELQKKLIANQNKIQCIVSNKIVENSVEFGSTQSPSIDDYADKINTIDFLLKLS